MNKYILLISGIISVALSSIISAIPIGTADQAEISAKFSTMITPATFTFSIWGVIYASWIALGMYFFMKGNFVKNTNLKLLAGAQILSSLWLLPSQFEYITLSFIVMLGVLGFLAKLFFESRTEEKYFRYVVDVFFGWIIVASIANFHQTLVALDVYAFPVILTILSIIGAGVVFGYLALKYNAWITALVAVWAGYGIYAGQENTLITSLGLILSLGLTVLILQRNQEYIRNIFTKIAK